MRLKTFLWHHRIIFLVILYLLFRLSFLLRLPIFNDEAIYLDWGWRETHNAGYLFYSLYDAKQPLLMWLFGIVENFFQDPLLSGRTVSACMGLISLFGIYFLTKKLFSIKIALVASFLYIVIPIFSFYDRQALMESTIGAIGIWSCYLFIQLYLTNSRKFAILLGVVLGLGFFTKSTTLLFFPAIFACTLYLYLQKKLLPIGKTLLWSVLGFFGITFLLFLQPEFWSTLESNSRYSLTFSELLHFPFLHILNTTLANSQIAFFFLTPMVLFFALFGIILLLRQRKIETTLLCLWVVIPILFQTLLIRFPSQRYLVSFLPLFCLIAGYAIVFCIQKFQRLTIPILFLVFLAPAYLTILQLISPSSYILDMSIITFYSENAYVQGVTSGYGVIQAISYLQARIQDNNAAIGMALNTGNPESAVMAYFQNNPQVISTYIGGSAFTTQLAGYDCLSFGQPFYFVSRETDTAGLERFLQKEHIFNNPYETSSHVGVYTLKQHCKGKLATLTPQMQQ